MLVSRDIENLAIQIGSALKSLGLVLATAESCTGGAVASAITDIAGSSEWFERGFITYSNEAKREMLGVAQDTLTRYGAVSEAVVREMVAGALYHSHAQVALAVSGIAGPAGGMPDKPVGTVWFAWGIKGGQCVTRLHQLSGNRAEIRMQSVCIAFQGVLELLNQVTEVA
ncbi:MAG: nicotinamide-nucleotide amidohydrolase family protein [Betaproteobacteria bacterium]|nr:nicotinamide-nucleotide amidohydrolase family protein [Betaproteobacteria bacterium]MCX7195959.1 nicotinamide-nucleotide amidohydrolase family protein [Pseudomonadota bacterium]